MNGIACELVGASDPSGQDSAPAQMPVEPEVARDGPPPPEMPPLEQINPTPPGATAEALPVLT